MIAFECELGPYRSCHEVWAKAILSLATVSDHIMLKLSPGGIVLSALNQSRVAQASIEFAKEFFDKSFIYKNRKAVRILLVASHFATLFKSSNARNIDGLRLQISSFDSQQILIAVKSNEKILKMYSASFRLIDSESDVMASRYKSLYNEQRELRNLSDESRIKLMSIDIRILNGFLATVPGATEELVIEILSERVSFTGYSRCILKDEDYLRSPMAVSVGLPIQDLAVCDVISSGSLDIKDYSTRFSTGMKEIRLFIDLVTSLQNPMSEEFEDLSAGKLINVWFKSPADPIVFESEGSRLTVCFTQLGAELNNDPTTKESVNVTNTEKRSHKRQDKDLSTKRQKVYPQHLPESIISTESTSSEVEARVVSQTEQFHNVEELGPTQVDKPKSLFD
ncbi:hypothetical protein DIRU0_E04456 [Diutina rugosa]